MVQVVRARPRAAAVGANFSGAVSRVNFKESVTFPEPPHTFASGSEKHRAEDLPTEGIPS